jgi:exosome complex component RRP45
MPREVEPSLNEKQFFAKALQENIRLDGRALDQFRALELDFGDEYGVADVKLGKTRCVKFLMESSFTFPFLH